MNTGQFWKLIGQRAIGATIVTARGEGGPAGFLALSAAHVEADPPTMLTSAARTTSALSAILEQRHFAINVLPREAAGLVDIFSGKTLLSGAERFQEGEWTELETGAPAYRRALAVFDCRLDEIVERRSSVILIGIVAGFSMREDGEPLLLFRGSSGSFHPD
jgi:flavin reductase (DIM6/NTAB) family NADH-FMN oxidoreductase RutF